MTDQPKAQGRADRADRAEARAYEAEGALCDIDSEVPMLFECYDGTDEVDEDRPVPLYDRVVALRERAEAAEARVAELEAGSDGEDLGALSEEKPWLARSEVAPSAPPSAEPPQATSESEGGAS